MDWDFDQKIYGWSALQLQAWARGELVNLAPSSQRIVLYTDAVLELWIGDQHLFGGDFYGFRKAPAVIDVPPGVTVVNVRLLRDVRSMGGTLPPELHALLRADIVHDAVEVAQDSMTIADVVDHRLTSPYASITVRNQGDHWIAIHKVTTDHPAVGEIRLLGSPIRLAPGQTRPVSVVMASADGVGTTMTFSLVYCFPGGEEPVHQRFTVNLSQRNLTSPHKFTFCHPSGTVSYAILRPPSCAPSHRPSGRRFPIFVNLHGAGLDVDGHLVRHMFDGAPDLAAWVLFPTGMSPWSGDDWHTWGFGDVEAAIKAVPDWMDTVQWSGPGLQPDQLFISGHSNGGQGTWYYATHQPDRVLAAAPASGYSSIENYVPFVLWTEADPMQDAILHAARANFRHELLVENMRDIPILQQHGSADDNVPPYHSRLMNSLLAQVGSAARYSELSNKGHWFEGVMTTPALLAFYDDQLGKAARQVTTPRSFAFVCPNSHDLGSRYGIVIEQLATPDRLGRVQVAVSTDHGRTRWLIQTSNLHRLRFDLRPSIANIPDEIVIDDTVSAFKMSDMTPASSLVMSPRGSWVREEGQGWKTLGQRHGRQRGALDAILRTHGAFQLVFHSNPTFSTALQISRNLVQYFGADADLVQSSRYDQALKQTGNVIRVVLGKDVPGAQLESFPIRVESDRLIFHRPRARPSSVPLVPGMGGVWLQPLPDERLELLVWGYDEPGLRQAARLVPTLTGAGQPDFVVLKDEARWKGHAGTLAMGFFDHEWMISAGSYLP